MTEPITRDAVGLDLSQRFLQTTTVATSPTGTGATVIASLTVTDDLAVEQGVRVEGFAQLTVGTGGTSVQLQVRQTDGTGTAIADSGAISATGADLVTHTVLGVDTGPTLPGQVYALVATVAGAGATASSSVTAAALFATVV